PFPRRPAGRRRRHVSSGRGRRRAQAPRSGHRPARAGICLFRRRGLRRIAARARGCAGAESVTERRSGAADFINVPLRGAIRLPISGAASLRSQPRRETMTPQERELVVELFDRLTALENAPRDTDAERAIAEGLGRAPHGVYALVQTVLVQD